MNETSIPSDTGYSSSRPRWLGVFVSALFVPAYLCLAVFALLVGLSRWSALAQPALLCVALGAIILSCIPVTIRQHRLLNRASISLSVLGAVLAIGVLAGTAAAIDLAAGRIRETRNGERIHSTFSPIITAVYAYEHDYANGPPPNLGQLVPIYLKALPRNPQFTVEYGVSADSTNWFLRVSCPNGDNEMVYLHRAGNRYSQSERQRMKRVFHQTWAVFAE